MSLEFVYVPVAQLDRVSDSDSEGRAFESHRAYQKKASTLSVLFLTKAVLRRNKFALQMKSLCGESLFRKVKYALHSEMIYYQGL